MGFLTLLLLGLVIGVLGKAVMPGADPGGVIVTILLGIAGAFVGGFIGQMLGFGAVSGFNIRSLLLGTLGAVLLLWLYRMTRKAA